MKIYRHFKTRFEMALMGIFCFLFILIWPLLLMVCNHIWLIDFRELLVKRLEELDAENEENSLW